LENKNEVFNKTQVEPLKNKSSKSSEIRLEKSKETQVIPNIFDKLDPKHVLTLDFIKEYIKKEKEYSDFILKKINDIKDIKGGNKKRTKSKRIKSKRKTRVCKNNR
jgi:hypothetical protein